ncbi:fructosamine kinase family protein [Nesterenkonia marinintestina]|uniref:fructosamine kinase family protein n=1 Tax=Nesterenkonia marinintestina TaxID=2979865 RepID=UPI0021C20734|nr:fructosamine kinase family protein [Nesterenkonia sp. GX14115]
MTVFEKETPAGHPEAALIEAAGLRWLDEAARSVDGVAVAQVQAVRPGRLTLERIEPAVPDEAAAHDFGRRLARTHRSLAHDADLEFGMLPPEHPTGAAPLFGPADHPLPMGASTAPGWGAFHASQRLDPLIELLHGSGDPDELRLLRAARGRIASGELDDDEPPALIHGDLWAGNVLWRAQDEGEGESLGEGGPTHVEAVLIDPAAHLGHRETDIGFLHLFGLPGLDDAMVGYESEVPLRQGWRDRIPMHQLFCLAAHRALFGTAYRGATLHAAERVLSL